MDRPDPRYGRKRNRRVRDRRTIPVLGYGEDTNKWFECWNCGQHNQVGREALDEGPSGDFSAVPATSRIPSTPQKGKPLSYFIDSGIGHESTVMLSDSNGDPQTPVVTRTMVRTGCSFCGTHAWKY